MAPASESPPVRRLSRLSSALAVVSASVAAAYLLSPDPLADVFFAGWVLGGVGLSIVGAVAAWTDRTPLVWVAALLLTGLSILGMWSIGLFVAPAALCLLGAAVLSQRSGPRTDTRESLTADPPTVRDAGTTVLAGVGAVALGGWLVYASAVERGLFGACASETVACVIETTHWSAVGLTLLGLTAVGIGGWLVWKQVTVARVVRSDHAG